MFPSEKKEDNYGIFTKIVFDFFQNNDDFKITKTSLIRGKSFSKLYNIIRYFIFLMEIFIKLFFIRGYDIVYFQYVWVHVYFTAPFFSLIRKNEKKIIINFHGEDLTKNLSSQRKKNRIKKILSKVDLIIVPSIYFKNLILSNYNEIKNILEDKIFVSASGGVNSSIFGKGNLENFLPPFKIVYCSRFDEGKGWDTFIKSIHKLFYEFRNDLKVTMIGYGNQTQNVYELVHEFQLNSVITIREYLTQSEIADIYSNSVLFVFPTKRTAESLGLCALEAMSCGLAVIGSNIGALPEYIKDGRNGYLTQPDNADDLAEKIKKYLSLPIEDKKSMSQSATKLVEKYLDKNVRNDLLKKLSSL